MSTPGDGVARAPSRRGFIRRALTGGVGASIGLGGSRAARAQSGPIRSFDHVAVPMRDVDAMLAYYRALGFQVQETRGICSVHFGDSKINLHRPELWQQETFTLRAAAAEPPCGDFCFVWADTVEALEAAFARADAEVIEGPVPRLGGRDGGTVEGTSHYVRDPDGNLLEFIVY